MTIARGMAGALSVWTKCRQPLRAPAPLDSRICLSSIDMMPGADRRRDDVGFDDVAAGQRLDDTPPRQHDDLVAQPLKFRRVRGIDDDRRARIR